MRDGGYDLFPGLPNSKENRTSWDRQLCVDILLNFKKVKQNDLPDLRRVKLIANKKESKLRKKSMVLIIKMVPKPGFSFIPI